MWQAIKGWSGYYFMTLRDVEVQNFFEVWQRRNQDFPAIDLREAFWQSGEQLGKTLEERFWQKPSPIIETCVPQPLTTIYYRKFSKFMGKILNITKNLSRKVWKRKGFHPTLLPATLRSVAKCCLGSCGVSWYCSGTNYISEYKWGNISRNALVGISHY